MSTFSTLLAPIAFNRAQKIRAQKPRPQKGTRLLCVTTALVATLAACTPSSCNGNDSTGDNLTSTSAKENGSEVAETKAQFGDLEAIQQSGTIRFLVPQPEELALRAEGTPFVQERQIAKQFATSLGVKARFIYVKDRSRLLEHLLAGKGDAIAAQMTITPKRAKKVAFSTPLESVSEWLIGSKIQSKIVKGPKDLAGKEVHVRQDTTFITSLKELQKQHEIEFKIVQLDGATPLEQVLYDVERGKKPLTMIDSNFLPVIQKGENQLEPLLEVKKGQQLAWAFHPESPELLAAANRFLTEHNLSPDRTEIAKGDIQAIKERGTLRVLTRNNPVTYFLYRGKPMGFDYELSQMLANELGVRLRMIVAPSHEELVPWLQEGRGDIIAASFTLTAEREKQVRFSQPYLYVQELLIQAKNSPQPIKSLDDLRDKIIHVRRSSSYYTTLVELQRQYGPFTIQHAPEEMETEDLIGQVGEGTIPLTVADSHIFFVEQAYRDDVEAALILPPTTPAVSEQTQRPSEERVKKTAEPSRQNPTDIDAAAQKEISVERLNPRQKNKAPTDKAIAFAIRQGNPNLKNVVDGFVNKIYRGLHYNIAKTKYFENKRSLKRARQERYEKSKRISPYDSIIKKYAQRYNFDWRLLAAQAYQESRFDPNAKSWAGARGLFQLMPATARGLGYKKLGDPEVSAAAATEYLHQLLNQFDTAIEYRHRLRFALASYNVGYGHVQDARRLARQLKLDPDQWFDNVEKAMLLLEKRPYYQNARYGYCRGREPVNYVADIQLRYDNYIKLVP